MTYKIEVEVLTVNGSVPVEILHSDDDYTITVEAIEPGSGSTTYSTIEPSYALDLMTAIRGYSGSIGSSGYTGSRGAIGPQLKGITIFCAGTPLNNEIIGGGLSPYDFTIDPSGCAAKSLFSATASTEFVIKNNGTQIGTVTFSSGSSVGVVSISSSVIALADYVTCHAPALADSTISDISILIKGQ